MKSKFFFVVSATMLLAACNGNDEVVTSFDDDTPQVSNKFVMSDEEVTDVLNFFVNDGATTRNEGKKLNVKSYKVRNVEVKTEDKTEYIPVYEYTTVNEKGDEGYSIVVADSRIQKVLVQVEKGSLADTAMIEPLKWYINSIPNMVTADLQKFREKNADKPVTRSMNSYVETHYCFLPTHWAQESPYNAQCPSCGSGGNCPVGCVPLAMGQILAYHRVPSQLSWTSILQSYQVTSSSSSTVKSQVANLLANLGNQVNAYYYCDSTSVHDDDNWRISSTFINSYSLQCSSLNSFNIQEVINSIGNDRPVFMMGKTNSDEGHAWVCDGWKRHHYDTDYYLS